MSLFGLCWEPWNPRFLDSHEKNCRDSRKVVALINIVRDCSHCTCLMAVCGLNRHVKLPQYAFGSTLFELRRCCTLRRRLAVTVIIVIINASGDLLFEFLYIISLIFSRNPIFPVPKFINMGKTIECLLLEFFYLQNLSLL